MDATLSPMMFDPLGLPTEKKKEISAGNTITNWSEGIEIKLNDCSNINTWTSSKEFSFVRKLQPFLRRWPLKPSTC